jgi:hypothetical protein
VRVRRAFQREEEGGGSRGVGGAVNVVQHAATKRRIPGNLTRTRTYISPRWHRSKCCGVKWACMREVSVARAHSPSCKPAGVRPLSSAALGILFRSFKHFFTANTHNKSEARTRNSERKVANSAAPARVHSSHAARKADEDDQDDRRMHTHNPPPSGRPLWFTLRAAFIPPGE